MTQKIDTRRVMFTGIMGTLLVFALALTSACGAGFANQNSRSTVEVDDGINPIRRTTITHQGSANSVSIGLPMMGMAGYGAAGYGNPVVGGGNLCMVHPDYCGTVVTVMASQIPQAPTRYKNRPLTAEEIELERFLEEVGFSGTNPALEGRVANLEKKSEVNRQILIRDNQNRKIILGTLDSALMLNAQSCTYIIANPDSFIIENDPELTISVRAKVLTKCADIVSKKGSN